MIIDFNDLLSNILGVSKRLFFICRIIQNVNNSFNHIFRALNPDYADGISAPRSSHGNTPLPSARTISLSVHRPSYSIDPNFTVMLAVFGQFLDHDITATALNQGNILGRLVKDDVITFP